MIDSLPPVPGGLDMNKFANKQVPEGFGPQVEVIEEQVADIPQPEMVEEVAQAAPVDTPEPVQETKKEMNLRIMRERMEKAERETEQLRRQYAQPAPQQQQQYQPMTNYNDIAIDDDEIAEGKHVKQLVEQNKQLANLLAQQAQNNDETRIRLQHPDFDKVVNQDTIQMLKHGFPPLYDSIMSNSNLYSKGVAAYTMIKSLGISAQDAQDNEGAIVAKNLSKPKSVNTVAAQRGDTPLTKANAFDQGLTPDLQKRLWKETQAAMRQKSNAY